MNHIPVPVSGLLTPDGTSVVSSPARKWRLSLGRLAPCSSVFALVVSALVSAIATPPVHAEYPEGSPWHPNGGGTVEVSTSTFSIRAGETKQYSLRLSHSPPAEADDDDPWFVFIVVDGERRPEGSYSKNGVKIEWVPSIYRQFSSENNDWRTWKSFSIKATSDPSTGNADRVSFKFSHHIWDHENYCPPHLEHSGKVTVTVTDEEVTPSLTIAGTSVNENAGPATFRVTLSDRLSTDVTVRYATSNGTATAGKDYTSSSGTLTIEAGSTLETISVPVRDDDYDEENETFTVTLSSPSGATIADSQAQGTIVDDDQPSSLEIDDVSVSEGSGPAVFTVTLSGASERNVTVQYATSDVTATAGQDYSATGATLTFGPQDQDTTQTISVSVQNDEYAEVTETFRVTLSNASRATIANGVGVGTINDDGDQRPALDIDDVSVGEGDGSTEFTVTLSKASNQAVTVQYATSDGSATSPADYTAGSETLTFAIGSTEQKFTVPVVDDTEDESNEMFEVTLSNASGADIADGEGEATVIDNDGGGNGGDGNGGGGNGGDGDGDGGDGDGGGGSGYAYRDGAGDERTLAIDDVTVSEDGGPAEFTVTMSKTSTADVTVGYATANRTARAGQDYTGTSGTLTIAAGSTKETIRVRVLDDEYVEGDETFTVRLSDANGATIADGVGVGVITDDEQIALTVSYGRGSYTVTEGSAVAVTVVLSRPPGRSIAIALTHTRVGADASDYSGVPDTVRFGGSETERSFSVSAARDGVRDPGEQVILGFGTLPSNVTELYPRTSTITIVDDPPLAEGRRNQWLLRFGETAAGHVLEALDERIRCAPIRHPVPGGDGASSPRRGCEPRQDEPMTLVVAGHRLPVGSAPSAASGLPHPADGFAGAWTPDDWTLEGRGTRELRSLTSGEVLALSTFQMLSGSPGGAERLSFWGRGALSRFDDEDAGFDLGGDVATATLGVDYADRRLLAGIALSHSEGDGSYRWRGLDRGADASLTGLYPYLYLGVNERVSVWGAAGFGSGTLKLASDGEEARTDIGARMGAAGARREIIYPADNYGVSMAFKADALFLRIDSDQSLDLDATRNAANRQRLGMELSQEFTLKSGEWIAPLFEAGLRRDAGDAETSVGMEVSGGLRYEFLTRGVTADFETRGLLGRADDLFDELGVSGSLRYDPVRHSNLGPSLTLSLSGGLAGWTGSGGLWGQDLLRDWGPNDVDTTVPRIDAAFGYGLPIPGGSATATPWIGASISERWRDWRLGYRLGFGPDVYLGIDGRLREDAAGEEPSDYTVMLRLSIH